MIRVKIDGQRQFKRRSSLAEQTTPAFISFAQAAALFQASNLFFSDGDLDATEIGGNFSWTLPAVLGDITFFRIYFSTTGTTQGDDTKLLLEEVSASNVTFTDYDLDETELAGVVEWLPPPRTDALTAYLMYLARDSSGSWKSQIGTDVAHVAGASTVQLDIPADTAKGSNTATWIGRTPPSEVTYVSAFRVFLATDAVGSSRWQIGSDVDVSGSNYNASESNTFLIPANTNFTGFSHCVVYTRSILLEQSTPTSLEVSDLNGSVSDLRFSDQDLDKSELGGDVFWQPPGLLDGRVQSYSLYLSFDEDGGALQSQISNVAVGTNTVAIAAETPLDIYQYLTVYSISSLEAQTTPVALLIDDADATVVNLTFPECDLDAEELGGVLTWEAPSDVTEVTNYLVYLAEPPSCHGSDATAAVAGPYMLNVEDTKGGWCRQRYAINELGHQNATLPADTILVNLSHWLVYSSSSLAEQTTPAVVEIIDHNATVGTIDFVGTDLNMDVVNGSLVWQEPADLHCLESYVVYIAADATGAGRSKLGESPVGTNALQIVDSDAYGGYTHFVVYTRSSFVEQTTPNSLSFAAATAKYQVSSPSFTDYDLDLGELGGTIGWESPEVTVTITGYRVYLAEDINGTNKTLLGEQVKGTGGCSNYLTVPVNTELLTFSYVLIHSLSATTEQRTPVTLALVDAVASVSNLQFTDQDLDDLQAKGVVLFVGMARE
eukprot:symbB.v1.2.035541.t1/scaffold4796.1/size34699/1